MQAAVADREHVRQTEKAALADRERYVETAALHQVESAAATAKEEVCVGLYFHQMLRADAERVL